MTELHAPTFEKQPTRLERIILVAVLGAMVVLPVVAVLVRWIAHQPFAAANLWTQSLNLILAFVGAVAAAGLGKHLSLSTGEIFRLKGRKAAAVQLFTGAVAAMVTVLLAKASVDLVIAESASALKLPGGIPNWVIEGVMPLGFGLMALRLIQRASPSWKARALVVLAALLVFGLAFVPVGSRMPVVWVGSAVLLSAVALGAPIYTILGGLAMLFFYGQPMPNPIAAVPAETFRIVASPTLPALPLFTLAGYLLAEGGASKRLVALFQHGVGWLPGGIAASAVLVCAFFTTFTGASGVTILALGGLLYPVLTQAGYSKRFAVGLLTASGSIGLLFPPSLPVILYGVVSHVPIDDLFKAGVAPGLLLVGMLVGLSLWVGHKEGVKRGSLDTRLALASFWEARWEVMLPVLVLWGIFGGFLTVFEAAACTAAYAFFSEVVIHKDLSWGEGVPRVFGECGTLMGGVLIILGVAMGLTNYLVDAQVPMVAAQWVEAHVSHQITFILLLNIFLLVVGCLMDIYSAIMVVVPLIVPIAAVFHMNPVHLGILFLANLELGYLTPPVGMNLFLASYRFNQPLTQVYRMALPFLGVLLVGVLVIAYQPKLTTWFQDGEGLAPVPSLDDPVDEDETGGQPALPLGALDLDALLAEDDDDSASGTPEDEGGRERGDDDSAAVGGDQAESQPE